MWLWWLNRLKNLIRKLRLNKIRKLKLNKIRRLRLNLIKNRFIR